MRVLGIDLGLKRSGLALSDPLGISVRLLDNLQANNLQEAIEKIDQLVGEFDVTVILIGWPQSQSEKLTPIQSRAKNLKMSLEAFYLSQKKNLRVLLWDETFSSKKAMKNLIDSGVAKQKRKAKLDSSAAAELVQDFLLSQKK